MLLSCEVQDGSIILFLILSALILYLLPLPTVFNIDIAQPLGYCCVYSSAGDSISIMPIPYILFIKS